MATRLAKKTKLKPTRHSAKSLGLSKSALPHSIVEVIATLKKAGFVAYVVGGGVRDSLLGLAPKDFDAVTNARPHEIKAIFGGRCRIIGKRFMLAHVYSGRELIEVATFRAPPKDDTHTTDEGMITRDNVWGTIEEDFIRRDFSINALYYDPIKGEVLDFCGAIDDIAQKKLRLLGDAKVRIEEDPVRLLRALRFKAKLGFDFDADLKKQFHEGNWALLEQVSAHRLYDETQKMFGGGYLTPLLPLLFEYGAMGSLMTYPPKAPTPLMQAVAQNTDKRIAQELGANPAFFYATLLWENYLYQLAKFKKRGLPFYDAQTKAVAKVMSDQRLKTAIPRFAEEFIGSIWLLQPKLTNPKTRDVASLETKSHFRAGFDFLLMREAHDDSALAEPTGGMGAWWQRYQVANLSHKANMSDELDGMTGTRRRRKSRQGDEKTPIQSEPILPAFKPVAYTEADFLRLLASDEPYIPAQRYRRRTPSSHLSLKEQIADDQTPKKPKQSKTKDETAKPKKTKDKSTKPKKPKTAKADKSKPDKSKTPKSKKRKKSNAKPRERSHD